VTRSIHPPTTPGPAPAGGRRAGRRSLPAAVPALALAAALIASCGLPGTGSGPGAGTGTSPGPTDGAPPPASGPVAAEERPPTPTPTPVPTPTPTPTPEPTPVTVPAPLTGRPVSPAEAARHPVAVMVDDLRPARPQSGFNDASVVWHAPAEGGIPRYMLVFQERIPGDVGPVRSARPYYIAWASELNAVYVHVGGSPQALAQLRDYGRGQQVYNADEFRYGGTYLWRVRTRSSPHNVYTDGEHLRELAGAVGARDGMIEWPWQFGRDLAPALRPTGGVIETSYPANTIRYTYDRLTNTYRRAVTGEKRQIDAATDQPVAPKNVIVMRVSFGTLADPNPAKGRLDARIVGKGEAWIATNGRAIHGTWHKADLTAPTEFRDADGRPVVLTVGQTFIQVIPRQGELTVRNGRPAAPDAPAGATIAD
jgi:hypothetical protein